MSPGAAVIKHYQIVSCLGQGGFGKVFEAWDSKLQRSVAIKCLNADGLLSPATDLLREARMAASLNHPAFVKIHALEDDDNSQAIVMELIKGETLKQVIVNQLGATQSRATQSGVTQSGVTQAIDIIRQIAEAMQQAHELGLTHGDLKPSNIMLEPSGAIRILDFGLASKADTQATTSMLQQDPQGTIAYMAPERLLGAPLGPSIDVYALGVIFYELLNSQRPFAELNGLALAAALVQSSSDQWNYAQELSPQLIHIIRCMTAKQATQRLSSMADVLDQLDAFKNGTLFENNSAPAEVLITPKVNNESSKNLRNKHLKNAVLFSFLIIGCVVLGGWLTRNFLWHFEEVIPRYSESQEMKLGMNALEQWDRPGSLDTAIKHFNNLAEQNPGNAAAIAGLSIAYSLKYYGESVDKIWLNKALAAAQQAATLDPHLALGRIAMGRALYGQNKYPLAMEQYKQAQNLDPSIPFSWYGAVDILYDTGRYDEALTLVESCILKFPNNRVFFDQLGSIYTKQGKYEQAEKAYRRSISIQPDSVYAYASLGNVLSFMQRDEEALHVLQQGLLVRPSAWLYTNIGNVYFFLGDYVNAALAFEQAVQPSLGNTNDYVLWANLADTLLWIPGRKDEANKYYEKAYNLLSVVSKNSDHDATLISRLALYGARLQKKDLSEKLLKDVVSQTELSPDVYFRAGLAYELLKERDLALRQIKKAYESGYPLHLIEAEPDLALLRRDPRFKF